MTSEDKPAGGRRFAPPSGRRRWLRIILMLVGIGSLILASAAGVAALWAFTILPRSLPSVKTLETFQPIQGTKVYDDNDELLTELHVERRIFVPLAHIPQTLRDAVIATEDRRFYSHFGVDPIGVARAVWQNYRRGRIVEGGSTITQQLTKVLFLTPDKSLERKMKEAALALELERRYSKDRILEMYMNQIYFGNGAYGVEAAARTYFGKSVSELSVKDAALIAGLPRAPSTYSPFEHPEAAKRRREVVLRRLVEYGAVKDPDAKKLARADLGLIPPERRRTTGQYFLEFVQQTLEAKYGADMVFKGGLNVYTTLNPTMQLVAEQSLRDGLKALEGRSKTARPGEHPEGAIVTIEPQTGYVRAMVGGYDFFRSELSRAVRVARRFGITSPLDVNLSLALGTSDLTLLELTSAYATLANQGAWLAPTTVRYVTDAQGKLLEEHIAEPKEAVPPETAYVITHMLRGVVERGTGQAAKVLGRPIAAKTGTTNDYSNAWFVGYTPRVATGVWVGYDLPRSLGKDETGSRVAVPIWIAYMSKVLGQSPREDFPVPDKVVLVPVDLDPSNECVRVVTMAFVKGTEPPACGRRPSIPPAPLAAPGAPQAELPTTSAAPPATPPPPVLPREAFPLPGSAAAARSPGIQRPSRRA